MSVRTACAGLGGEQHGGADSPSKPMAHCRTSSEASCASLVGETGQFDCNICLDMAYDPVVTVCGHLYCWPCIYKWLRQHEERQLCPVCKAFISKDKVIPIYGRGRPQVDPRKRSVSMPVPMENVPERPAAQRSAPQQHTHVHSRAGSRRVAEQVEENMLSDRWGSIRGPQTAAAGTSGPMSTLSAGLSCLPSLFGLHFSGLTEQGGPAEGLSPEQAQQALLSRLLLLLGSMVILCLLLF
ncbi:hypothetical protein AB1Y20_003134 [Prymnesium parvum]|uniref:RING-type E3 ubiquitin transferase n=1 Tax=Prymnesium parvum TaxID=97485 RepID=A0AB34JDP0_PRYPA|mmetsp:Transcript_4142/g.8699  ORF Transcript_4142/g.8699 Transcript_4142/m.8699 type:complete len:240 (+) Transcript_4142:62-781(+)